MAHRSGAKVRKAVGVFNLWAGDRNISWGFRVFQSIDRGLVEGRDEGGKKEGKFKLGGEGLYR